MWEGKIGNWSITSQQIIAYWFYLHFTHFIGIWVVSCADKQKLIRFSSSSHEYKCISGANS